MQLNFFKREVGYKVVYFGPRSSGKKTNLVHIYHKMPPHLRGELFSTSGKDVLFFDILPVGLGIQTDLKVSLRVCASPWQPFYKAMRNFILRGVDGVVFVADSRSERIQENLENLQFLERTLSEQGIDIRDLSLVIQWNKRDHPEAASVAELESRINYLHVPTWEAVASTGQGVLATLKKCASPGLTQKIHSLYHSLPWSIGEKNKDWNDPAKEPVFLAASAADIEKTPPFPIFRHDRETLTPPAPRYSGRGPRLSKPLAGGLGNLIYFRETEEVAIVHATLERALASMPKIFTDYLLFDFSLKNTGFYVELPDRPTAAEKSDIGNYPSRLELVLGQRDLNELSACEILAETFAAYLLPDYEKLKAQYDTDESAYFKLELFKSLINYRSYYKKYHKYTNRIKGSALPVSDTVQGKCFLQMWFLALESKSPLLKPGQEPVSFRHVFTEIVEDRDLKWIILKYLHVFLRHFLIRQGVTDNLLARHYAMVAENLNQSVCILLKNVLLQSGMRSRKIRFHLQQAANIDLDSAGTICLKEFLDDGVFAQLDREINQIEAWRKILEHEIFSIIRAIATLELPQTPSIARTRNFFKEFVCGGTIKRGDRRYQTFKYFENTAYWQGLYRQLLESTGRENFHQCLGKTFAGIWGISRAGRQHNKYEFDDESWEKGKDAFIRTVVEKLLVDWLGRPAYQSLAEYFSGRQISDGDLAHIEKVFFPSGIGGSKDWFGKLFPMEPPLP